MADEESAGGPVVTPDVVRREVRDFVVAHERRRRQLPRALLVGVIAGFVAVAFQGALDLADVAELWRRGSVITSWLLDLTAGALAKSPRLDEYGGRVADSGEGRWTLAAAIDEAVPAHVLTAALLERFASRGEDDFQNRVLSAMRFGFGGHQEKK